MVVAPYLDTLLLLMVVASAVNDLASRRIPNRLLLAGIVGALGLHLASSAPLAGVLAWLGGMVTGPIEALHIAILAWCAGGVMALAIVAVRGRLLPVLANLWTILRSALLRLPLAPAFGAGGQDSVGSMPYGVAIAAGTVIIWISRYG